MSVWDFFIFSDQASGADEAIITDCASIQDGGAHSDKAIIPNAASVHDGSVPYGTVRSDDERITGVGVEDGAVLNIGSLADLYKFRIAAE